MENEVNMYVSGPGDETSRALFANLLGLVYYRDTGQGDRLNQLKLLRRHLASIGIDVPIYAISNGYDVYHGQGGWDDYNKYYTDLTKEPWHLELIEY